MWYTECEEDGSYKRRVQIHTSETRPRGHGPKLCTQLQTAEDENEESRGVIGEEGYAIHDRVRLNTAPPSSQTAGLRTPEPHATSKRRPHLQDDAYWQAESASESAMEAICSKALSMPAPMPELAVLDKE